jgi:phospholipid/cholesterol/gamma-HCH transport system substrate-binding protein
MENRAHALTAGLFALLLGAALLAALWWFSQDRQAVKEVVLVSRGNINGLGVQSRVRFRGINAGTVSAIRIDPEDPRNMLTRGTTASIGTLGVTGLAYVALEDRGADPAPLAGVEGQPPRIVLEPGLMDQIADRALAAAERFGAMAERLEVMFDDEAAVRFRQTLLRLESAATGMDRTFAEAPQLLEAMRSVFNRENLARLAALLAHAERAGAEAGPAVAELRGLLLRIDGMVQRLDRTAVAAGDGVIEGTLPRLNDLLRELTVTSRRLGRLIEEVEASPQLLFTGRGERAPGPGEAGFDPAAAGGTR